MKIIVIHEENHGVIGTATSKKAAFKFLIDHNWLTFGFDLYDEATGDWDTLGNLFEAKGIVPNKKNLLAWAMEYADDWAMWDGAFYFQEEDLCDEEDWI
jgi:hypothetical protein